MKVSKAEIDNGAQCVKCKFRIGAMDIITMIHDHDKGDRLMTYLRISHALSDLG